MHRLARLGWTVCGLAVALGVCGCPRTSGTKWGAGGGAVTVTHAGSPVSYALGRIARDDRVYFVIVGSGCSGFNWSGGDGNYRGNLLAKDGHTIDWSCTTRDGQGGTVVIDGHQFDLTKGGLFLVSAKDTPARVEQIPVGAGQLQPCADAKRFPELAPADPRIATFLQSSKVGE